MALSPEGCGPLGLVAEGGVSKLLWLGEQAITPRLLKQVSASLCLSFPLAKRGFLCDWEKRWEAGLNPRHPPGPSPPVTSTRQGAYLAHPAPPAPLGGFRHRTQVMFPHRCWGHHDPLGPLQPRAGLGRDKASRCAPAAPARWDGAPPPPAPLFGAKSKGFFCP